MYEFKLPDLGEGIHEGEILEWYVQVGDIVEEDQDLVEVETDKAAVTIPSPVSGKVVSLAGQAGDIVNVGTVLIVIESDAPEQSTAETSPEIVPSAPAMPPAKPKRQSSGGPIPAAPATRRLARELGVELALVTPTGPSGRVTSDDVRRHAQTKDAGHRQNLGSAKPGGHSGPPLHNESPPRGRSASAIPFFDLDPLPDFSQWGPVEVKPLRSIRRKVARKMVTSMTLVPHVANMHEADVTLLDELRREEKKRREGEPGGRLTLLAFVAKAVTTGLRGALAFNSSLDPFDETIIYKKYFNIGFAADTPRGLVVPVIHQADQKSIVEISAEIEELAKRAREGTLTVEQMRGATFTITNIGPLGSKLLIPAINYPEVAILGMGKAEETPVVRDGEVVIRTILPLTLAFDHRIADGADAARFMGGVARRLSDPKLLLLES